MRQRASRLRECAGRARRLAASLGTYLDPAAATARSAGLWKGPFAERSTQRLTDDRSRLHAMAGDLVASAQSWVAEAQRLEGDAKAVDAASAASTHGPR